MTGHEFEILINLSLLSPLYPFYPMTITPHKGMAHRTALPSLPQRVVVSIGPRIKFSTSLALSSGATAQVWDRQVRR